jgi:single-strand DNA-binding protein
LQFAIGTNVGFGDNKKTMWVDCAIWGKQGESAVRYLVKGQQIFVNGELLTKEYEIKGVVKTILTLRVNSFSFGAKPTNASTDNMPNDELVDEIPF